MVSIKIHSQSYVTQLFLTFLNGMWNSPAAPAVIGKGSHVFPFSFKFPDGSGFIVLSL